MGNGQLSMGNCQRRIGENGIEEETHSTRPLERGRSGRVGNLQIRRGTAFRRWERAGDEGKADSRYVPMILCSGTQAAESAGGAPIRLAGARSGCLEQCGRT